MEEIQNNKNTYVQGRILFLTYSRAPNNWKMEYVRDKLQEQLVYMRDKKNEGIRSGESKIESYVISEEDHKEPIGEGGYERGKHYHCVITLKRRDKILHTSLEIDGIKGNYQKVKNRIKTIIYVKKLGKYIEDKEGLMILESKNKDLMKINEEKDLKLMMLERNKLNSKEIIELWRDMKNKKEISYEREKITIKFHEQFVPFILGGGVINKEAFRILHKGEEIGIERPLGVFLYGPPHTGKTLFAKRMADKIGGKVFSVVEGYKEMSTSYKGESVFLFDEASEDMVISNEKIISQLITEENYHTVPAFSGSRDIVWPRKVVLASNEEVLEWNIWTKSIMLQSRIIFVEVLKRDKIKLKMFIKGKIKAIELARKDNKIIEESVGEDLLEFMTELTSSKKENEHQQ